jgi:hypothetical protein
MTWIRFLALALFLPLYCEYVVPPNTVAFAEHMVDKGEHCVDHCSHLYPLVNLPSRNSLAEELRVASLMSPKCFVVCLRSPYQCDRPPPLFYSLSHSLRAPPALIPA